MATAPDTPRARIVNLSPTLNPMSATAAGTGVFSRADADGAGAPGALAEGAHRLYVRARAPTARFPRTASAIVIRMPMAGSTRYPAMATPTTAPNVLTA